MRRIGMAALVAAVASTSSLAQDAPKSPEQMRLEQETTLLTAQAARDNAAAAAETARTARLKSQTDALGLPTVQGNSTIGTNGGVMEAWMLSASTADAAAAWIARDVYGAGLDVQSSPAGPPFGNTSASASTANGGPPPIPDADMGPLTPGNQDGSGHGSVAPIAQTVLLVGGDENFALDAGDNLRPRIAAADASLQAAARACVGGPRPATGNQQGGAIPIAAVGAVLNLLRSDSEISGVDVPVPNRMLVAAVGDRLRALGMPVRLPAAAIRPAASSPLANSWGRLLDARDKARACRAGLAGRGPAGRAGLAALDPQIAAVDALEATLTKPDDKGVTPLARAAFADALTQGDPWVLRVTVEKGGGSILKRSNVWTALGAPAIGISGGLVVTFTLTEPTTGSMLAGGALVCRTALTNMRDVQAGRVGGGRSRADCSPLMGVVEPPARR